MKKQLLQFAIPSLLLLLLSGCATVKVEKDKAQGVRKVAIVAFDVQQQKAVGIGDLIGAATKTNTPSQAQVTIASEAVHVGKMYDDLVKKTEKENKWKVTPQETVRTNPAYAIHFKNKTEGWQNRPMMNDRYVLMQPKGILDSFALMTTKPDTMKELQESLGVDALLIVSVKVNLNNNSAWASMVGQGKFRPIAVTSVQMIDARSNDRIWTESNAEGAPADNNEKNFMGMADDEKLNRLSTVAAQQSYDVLFSRYRETINK